MHFKKSEVLIFLMGRKIIKNFKMDHDRKSLKTYDLKDNLQMNFNLNEV